MEKKIVGFGGITNVPDDGLNEAGDMSVLMNMRHKGGELVPCQRPESIRVWEYAQVLYHASSGYWLALEDQDLGVYDKDMNYMPEQGIISGGVDKMPPEKRAQAVKILQTVFAEYADFFKEETDNESA